MGNDLVIASSTMRNPASMGAIEKITSQRGRIETWELLPRADLKSIIEVLNSDAQPASKEHAKNTAEIMIGSYPRNGIDDPEIYSRGIVSVLMKYPNHVGVTAVNNLTLESKFLPTRADLHQHCEKAFFDFNSIRSRALRMSEEHDRREKEARELDERVRNRKAFRDKYGGKSPLEVITLLRMSEERERCEKEERDLDEQIRKRKEFSEKYGWETPLDSLADKG